MFAAGQHHQPPRKRERRAVEVLVNDCELRAKQSGVIAAGVAVQVAVEWLAVAVGHAIEHDEPLRTDLRGLGQPQRHGVPVGGNLGASQREQLGLLADCAELVVVQIHRGRRIDQLIEGEAYSSESPA